MQQAVYFIFCLLLMSVPASYEGNIGARDFAPVLMSIAGVQSVFFSLIFCLLAKYMGKTVKYGVAFILLLLFIIETYTYIQFGSRFNSLILSLLLQTNIQEIKELAVFSDVISPSNGTNYMMEYVFSMKSCDSKDESKRNILFPTFWKKSDYRETPLTTFLLSASQQSHI